MRGWEGEVGGSCRLSLLRKTLNTPVPLAYMYNITEAIHVQQEHPS